MCRVFSTWILEFPFVIPVMTMEVKVESKQSSCVKHD